MNIIKRSWPLLLVLSVMGCASVNMTTSETAIHTAKPSTSEAAADQRTLLVGKWFGQATTEDGRIRKELDELKADGTFTTTFRTYNKNGGYEEQTEIGFWGVSGRIHFTIVRGIILNQITIPVDPSEPYYYDAYEIIKLDNQELEYREVTTGDIYKDKKVSNDYQLPTEF